MPRAKKKVGRPPALDEKQTETLIHMLCTGTSIGTAAKVFNVARNTIKARLRVPGVRDRIAAWKAQEPALKEQAIREWDEVKAATARLRKPRTVEQIMERVKDMMIEEVTPPPAPVAPPEPPKPQVVYEPLYMVPPVEPRIERPQVFQRPAATTKVRDWRSLPIPDLWSQKSTPAARQLKTHGYGSPVRSNWPR